MLYWCTHSTMGGVGIDLELWRARVGMFHAARCRSLRRGKGGRIPLVKTCFLALAVGMMVSLTPTVVNMLLLLGGDIELNPGPGKASVLIRCTYIYSDLYTPSFMHSLHHVSC